MQADGGAGRQMEDGQAGRWGTGMQADGGQACRQMGDGHAGRWGTSRQADGGRAYRQMGDGQAGRWGTSMQASRIASAGADDKQLDVKDVE